MHMTYSKINGIAALSYILSTYNANAGNQVAYNKSASTSSYGRNWIEENGVI